MKMSTQECFAVITVVKLVWEQLSTNMQQAIECDTGMNEQAHKYNRWTSVTSEQVWQVSSSVTNEQVWQVNKCDKWTSETSVSSEQVWQVNKCDKWTSVTSEFKCDKWTSVTKERLYWVKQEEVPLGFHCFLFFLKKN